MFEFSSNVNEMLIEMLTLRYIVLDYIWVNNWVLRQFELMETEQQKNIAMAIFITTCAST